MDIHSFRSFKRCISRSPPSNMARVRILASAPYVGCMSLLLVFSLAPRGFSPGTSVLPSPLKPTLSNSNSIWNARTRFNEFLTTPKCSVGAGDLCYQKDQPNCVIHWKEI